RDRQRPARLHGEADHRLVVPVDADRGDVADPHPGDVHVVAHVEPGHVAEHRLVPDGGGDPAVGDADAQDRGEGGGNGDEDRRLADRPGQALALHARVLRLTVAPRNNGAVRRLPQSGIRDGDRPSAIPVSSRTSSLSAGEPASWPWAAVVCAGCSPAPRPGVLAGRPGALRAAWPGGLAGLAGAARLAGAAPSWSVIP